MRPVYETEATLIAEAMTRTKIEGALGGILVKLPVRYALDWGLANPARSNTIERWVELKARSNTYRTYSTYALSAEKVMRALELEERTGIPGILVVRFTNGVYMAYFKRFVEKPVVIRIGGRADRDDPQDQEPMWHLPIDKLQFLVGSEEEHGVEESTGEQGKKHEDDPFL